MTKAVLVETDAAKRDQMIEEAYEIGQEQDWGYIPLHQQALAWGVVEENEDRAARRQPDPVLLVPQGIGTRGCDREGRAKRPAFFVVSSGGGVYRRGERVR